MFFDYRYLQQFVNSSYKLFSTRRTAFGDVGELAKTKLFIFMNKASPHLILTKIVSLLMHSYRDSYLLLIFTIPVPYIISKHKILKAHLKLFAIIQLKNYDCWRVWILVDIHLWHYELFKKKQILFHRSVSPVTYLDICLGGI